MFFRCFRRNSPSVLLTFQLGDLSFCSPALAITPRNLISWFGVQTPCDLEEMERKMTNERGFSKLLGKSFSRSVKKKLIL